MFKEQKEECPEKGDEKGRRKKRREYFNKEGASNYVERKRKFQVKRIMWI